MSIFDFFKPSKEHQATINGSSKVVVKPKQNLLAAGLTAGLAWPHDCRVGSCGTCRCYLKKGKIKPLNDFSYVLTPDQLDAGMILACQTALKSDVEIEVALDASVEQVISCEGTLARVRNLTHDIIEMLIHCDVDMPTMKAGQYAEISHKDLSKPRSYSFASSPQQSNSRELLFFVRHVPGGEFTDWLFERDQTGARFNISVPYGNFWLRDSEKPMICIAGGSGMSALKAVLEHAAQSKVLRDAYYFFGARAQRDLYCREEMEEVGKNWAGEKTFKYIEVLSDEPKDSDWQGPSGFVTQHLKEEYIDKGVIDAGQCQAYLCGPPPMIDAAIKVLIENNMPEDQIFYDKFLDASSIPGGR
ncbi:MAG: 2Fe-2S iron-sulfur cluster binding domain-containing protein [Chromatiales bacterium]|nr:2Fe-2S iron-sulfur cluster binding domain-containing protein [Chromatiales bacterium]